MHSACSVRKREVHIESVQYSRTSTAPHLTDMRTHKHTQTHTNTHKHTQTHTQTHSSEQAQCRTAKRSARRACAHKSTCLHCSHVGFYRFLREHQEGSLAVPSFLRPCAVLVGRNRETHRQRDELSARAFSEATGIVMDSGDVMDSYSI